MKFSLVVPAYNEENNIEAVVWGLHSILEKTEDDFEIIVIDNGSTDRTSEILTGLIKKFSKIVLVRILVNEGYGNGVLVGLARAQGEVLGWVDADGQIKPKDVIRVYQKLVKDKLDFCKGTRVSRQDGFFRVVQSRIYNVLFRIFFGGNCTDINAKPKFFRQSFYKKVNPSSRDWFLDAEVIIKAIAYSAKIGEVEVDFSLRQNSFSKVGIKTPVEFIRNMLSYKFLKKL